MAEKFVKTLWGEHWLFSFAKMNYNHRLPQGAAYARNGHVKNLRISRYQISAKVSGNRKTPYRVTIFVSPFAREQIDRLMAEIIKLPVVISKLLNNELDPVILSIAEALDIRIFPRQWTDFRLQCSCHDRTPCKHMAAVIHMLSREIDNDPFLVFEIHGLNLFDELRQRGVYIYSQRNTAIPLLRLLRRIKEPTPEDVPEDVPEDAVYKRIDFSQLQNISEAMIQLLPDAPPFYPSGNFHDKYAAQFGRVTRDAGRILSNRIKSDTFFPLPDKPAITSRTTLGLAIDEDNQLKITGENHEFKTLDNLIATLFELNPDLLSDLQPSVAAFHKIDRKSVV